MGARNIALADEPNRLQCEYYHSRIISLFKRTSPSKVTLGQFQFEGFLDTLRGNTFTTSSTTCVDNHVNVLPLNILNLASRSTYSVVSARDFDGRSFQRRELINLKSLISI